MTVRRRIVLAAADKKQRHRLRVLLEAQGYHVQATSTREEALHALEVGVAQLVIHAAHAEVDDLPTAESEFIARLRAATSAALIVLTGAPGDAAVVEALAAGADDAIAFPHPRAELVARIELAIRRGRRTARRRVNVCGQLVLDLESRELTVATRPIHLTRLEYRLLEELVLAAGHLVTHDDLLTRVWGPAHRGRLHYVRVYIGRLRLKVARFGFRLPITNVLGIGYRLDAGVATA